MLASWKKNYDNLDSILTEKPYHHLNKYRNTDSEKALDKIQYPLMTKNKQTNKNRSLSKLGKGRNFLNLIKDIYKNPTANCDCSNEIKRHLLLGRKAMTNLDSILKSRDITLPTKVRLVKAMVFPVVMYGCESWTGKKAECRRIDAFELWC